MYLHVLAQTGLKTWRKAMVNSWGKVLPSKMHHYSYSYDPWFEGYSDIVAYCYSVIIMYPPTSHLTVLCLCELCLQAWPLELFLHTALFIFSKYSEIESTPIGYTLHHLAGRLGSALFGNLPRPTKTPPFTGALSPVVPLLARENFGNALTTFACWLQRRLYPRLLHSRGNFLTPPSPYSMCWRLY